MEGSAQKTKVIKKGKKKRSPKVRIFVEKSQKEKIDEDNSDFRRDDEEKRVYEHPDSSSEMGQEHKVQTKKVVTHNEKYVHFFKYYYNRLASEHPRWTASQITTIVKLLWRKRKISGQRFSISEKPMSGRRRYRK